MKFAVTIIVLLFFLYPSKMFPQFINEMELINNDLEWSTYLGGSDLDGIINFDVKENGEIIVVGITGSSDFPSTPGLYDPTHNGNQDWFISCFNPDGSQLLWSTFIGGSDNDWIYDVEITQSGDIVLAGMTFSSNFPTTPGAYDPIFGGFCEGVLVKMEADGRMIDVDVQLRVELVNGLSPHSGRNELMGYFNNMRPKPKRIIVNHGEVSKSLDLASALYKLNRVETTVPRNLETIRLR